MNTLKCVGGVWYANGKAYESLKDALKSIWPK